jgi:hypothetical protein
VYLVYQFHIAPLLQHKIFWETGQRFYFHFLLASNALADLQPDRKFLHDPKMTAQCLAGITNYYKQGLVERHLKKGFKRRELTLLHNVSFKKNI